MKSHASHVTTKVLKQNETLVLQYKLCGNEPFRTFGGTSYQFIVFRRQLEDTSQFGIHEIIGFCIFPLVEMKNGHVIHQVKLLAAGIYPHSHTHTQTSTYSILFICNAALNLQKSHQHKTCTASFKCSYNLRHIFLQKNSHRLTEVYIFSPFWF